jgi:hypothetical protein
VSVVDWLKEQGQPTDFASRATLAASKGITGYTGSSTQNTQLLNLLRGSTTPTTPVTTPIGQNTTPQATTPIPTAQTLAGTGTTPEGIPISQLPPDLVWNGQLDISNPDKQTKYNLLVSQFRGANPTTPTSGLDTSFLNTPTIDLNKIYEDLYKSSGITDIENELSTKSLAYNEAVSKIKDNPYLSEATMTGRLKKLDDKFNADAGVLNNKIATQKADVETKLNIQMKQFDINSNQAQQALTQFQTLLSAGALNNASGEDIANITRATGLSSTMIYSAINAMKAKDVQTSVINYDDGTNQGFAVINSSTGEIIKKQVIASSKPKATTETSKKENYADWAKTDARAGKTLDDMMAYYYPSLSKQEIFDIYMMINYYHNTKEEVSATKKRLGVE